MKKTILFVSYGLGIGGIEKCLVNLLNRIPLDKYSVDVLLMNPEYDLKSQIKPGVNFLNTFDYVMNTTDTIPYIKNNGGYLRNLGTLIRYIIFRILNKYYKNGSLVFKPIKNNYNYAIAYSHDCYSMCYVVDKVNANKKFLFYHDGVYKQSDYQKLIDQKYFPKFDKIVAVSKCTKEMLVNMFPNINNQVIVLYNIIYPSEIINRTNSLKLSKKDDTFYITTVGRLVEQKQPVKAVEIAKMLKERGCKFIWSWVGDGNQRQIVEELITKYHLVDEFILYGNKNNPYPYFKQCDLYVQPSLDEAYCTTTNEARILGKVIIATKCSGMDEQIVDGKTGFIVDHDTKSIFNRIMFFYDNRDELRQFEKNVNNNNLDFSSYFSQYEKELFCD